jgi:hypothetical protein
MMRMIAAAQEDKILVTHGTDTLLETAGYFYEQFSAPPLTNLAKKIVVTGAMTPLANGPESDGYLNLKFAFDQLTCFYPTLTKVSVALCDFDGQGQWKPRLYPYKPGKYKKFYDPQDGRYNRIQLLP